MAFVSESLNKLGNWCLEIFLNQDKLLTSAEQLNDFEALMNRTLYLALNLMDSD